MAPDWNHLATASDRLATCNLCRMFSTCFFAVPSAMVSRWAMARLVAPADINASTSSSRPVRTSCGVAHPGDEHGVAFLHHLDLGHPTLEHGGPDVARLHHAFRQGRVAADHVHQFGVPDVVLDAADHAPVEAELADQLRGDADQLGH